MRIVRNVAVWLLAFGAFAHETAKAHFFEAEPLQVQTTGGLFEGLYDGQMRAFIGVPYAAPPVGSLRYAEPEAFVPENPTAVRETKTTAAACMQPNPATFPLGVSPEVARVVVTQQSISEDCLYLNVFTPKYEGLGSRPVMVWLHPGGFVFGSADQQFFDPQYIVDTYNVIVVQVQYRLNGFGFLALNGVTPNLGLLDQRAAMQWVYDNIEEFGGNKDNVTLWGQSGGAASVLYQVALPGSASVGVKKAIAESPAPLFALDYSQANAVAQGVAAGLGCTQTDPADVLSCVRDVPAEDLLAVFEAANTNAFTPSVGTGTQFPAQLLSLYATGSYNQDVRLLSGTGLNEGEMFMSIFFGIPNPAPYDIPEALFDQLVAAFFTAAVQAPSQIPAIVDYYKTIKTTAAISYWEAAALSITEGTFFCPLDTLNRAVADDGVPTWVYRQSHGPDMPVFSDIGAAHGGELPYVFNRFDAGFFPLQTGFSAREQKLANDVSFMWARFAHLGRPTPIFGQFGTWNRFFNSSTIAPNNKVFDFAPWYGNIGSRIITLPKSAHCQFWDGVYGL